MFSIAKAATPQPAFIQEGSVKFTPPQAALVLRELRYENQRDETRAKHHIADLKEMMVRGLWLPKSQLDFARTSGRLILVNGHHRMMAQSESGVDILWNIAIHDCETMQEVSALYYRFDTNVRVRSSNNILSGIDFASTVGLQKQVAEALYRAVPIIGRDLNVGRKDGVTRLIDDKIDLAKQFAPQAAELAKCFADAPTVVKKKLLKAGIFATALVTMRTMPNEARDFWSGLAENDGLRKADPRATLLMWLQTTDMNSGAQNAGVVAVAKAWAAHVQRRDLKIIKVNNGHRTNIVGTDIWVTP